MYLSPKNDRHGGVAVQIDLTTELARSQGITGLALSGACGVELPEEKEERSGRSRRSRRRRIQEGNAPS